MGYGFSYQGSKSRIAKELGDVLPAGERFVDLFGGGGAMTHYLALSGKYKSILYNDIQPTVVTLMREAVEGKYNYDTYDPEFISRERFFAEKETDAYIKYLWSFSSSGKSYMFTPDLEPKKKSIFEYICSRGRDDYVEQTFPDIVLDGVGIDKRWKEWKKKIGEVYEKTHRWERLEWETLKYIQPLEHLQRIQRLEQVKSKNIEYSSIDYHDYKYKDGDVVYCDIPYEGAEGYTVSFNHKEFYDWAFSQPYPIYFSSYDNISDERFKPPVWTTLKANLMRGGTFGWSGGTDWKVEALYCNKPGTILETTKQLDLFGEQ